MGYATNDSWVHIFEGRLTEVNSNATAERWVELLKHPHSENNLHLIIYRFRNEQKAEKKVEYPINGDTILGLEKGAIGTVHDQANRYIALIMKTSVLRFKMEEATCPMLYDMLRTALKHSSWRLYKGDETIGQALHLTSHYIALTKLQPLGLSKSWSLGDVCQVSQHDSRVSFTVFKLGASDKLSGFKEFVLKNAQIANRFKTEVESRLKMLGPSSEGFNEYHIQVSPASNRRACIIVHPSVPSSPPVHDPLSSDLYANLRQISEQPSSFLDSPPLVESPPISRPASPYGTKPAIPRRTPPAQKKSPPPPPRDPGKQSEKAPDHPMPPPIGSSNGSPPTSVKREYRKSLSMEEGRDRWDKFVNDFGVKEEIAHIGNHCHYSRPLHEKPPPPARKITRSIRSSIVPGRPTPKRSSPAAESSTEKQTNSIAGSSFSLYSFLFQVWNSKEITADTLGMDLKAWSQFVIYFELLSNDMPGNDNDWRRLAERIGISHMDIQVIDNYSRRFNQCASAIVMLFWQQNARSLKEEYSREALLKILRDLEREDLIEVINS